MLKRRSSTIMGPLAARFGAMLLLGGAFLSAFRLVADDRTEPRSAEPTIELTSEAQGRAAFALRGLAADELAFLEALTAGDDQWPNRFAVYVVLDDSAEGKAATDQPAMLGSYRVTGKAAWFTPRFPPRPGLRYRAVYRPADESSSPVEREFLIPALPETAATELQAIYPSAANLPRNQLKFYLHFSAPMGRGAAYEHLRLLDADDQPVDLPFLELAEELWDPSGRRLTLLLDPARVKRELGPREAQGPVLEIGRRYTLAIDGGWRDAAGEPLAAGIRKTFRVGPDDETPPAPRQWKLSPPAAGSRDPLVVRFSESLDHALLGRMLWVVDAEGDVLVGNGHIGDREESWRFVPQRPWSAGEYKLVADTLLEDLAGNSIARKFELRTARSRGGAIEAETIATPFEVKPAQARR
jgi:hypothetical protein